MSALVHALGIVGIALVSVGLGGAAWALSSEQPSPRSDLGLRGRARLRALRRGGMFSLVDPLVRVLAIPMAVTPVSLRAHIAEMLRQAGDWLGVTAEELLALSALLAVALPGIGSILVSQLDMPPIVLVFLAALGVLLPWIRVTGEAQRRQKHVDRALPATIDLVAMCMGAGLDFPSAIRKVVEESARPDEPLVEELGNVLSRMVLGETRQRALLAFAERVPTPTVKGFVTAVVQSELKGAPLVETLRIQAQTLRTRRSVAGEEAASRAAVLMMVPLMLILCAVILVLLGPFLVHGMESGL